MSGRPNRVMLAGSGPTPERRLFVAHDVKPDEKRVGPHEHLGREHVLALLPLSPVWPAQDYTNGRTLGRNRLIGAGQILDWLLTHAGDGWQARWRAADADRGKDWIEQVLAQTDNGHSYQGRRSTLLSGLNSMFISRIVLPDYEFMRNYKAMALFKDVQRMFPPGTLEQMRRHGSELGMTGRHA
ncbi:hypothetical protein GCM10017744_089880 [Streptomyces antimycoticus]|uniref:Uncharacterized protein n=1 Tax=Streptomyces antimycoticus TaxID=68175 RepID=A0A4D4JY11_9ACTN|nr:hypothetical protein [Streptomyces antimycoticus]GDY39298.1 hypothetical protein SANT12839_001800 [Streptomyces antimycoticus]